MNKLLMVGAAMFLMATGAAMAQSTTSQTTTTVTPSVPAPPPGTFSESRSQKTIGPDGTQTRSNETTYRDGSGVANDSVSRTTTYPPPPSVTTTRKSTTIETE